MTQLNDDVLNSYLQRILTGLIDFTKTNGFTKVLVGSSGGIDSALTIALAAKALGPENVTAITMPAAYSTAGSVTDSKTLCDKLGVELLECPVSSVVMEVARAMKASIGCAPAGLAMENLQARARAVVLMTYSNTYGHLLLTTGNKSEISVGYCTLYGDTCGGLNLIGDLYKTEVFALSRYLNEISEFEVIPRAIIEKAPSAELGPDQQDEDSLPAYPILDAILQSFLEPDDEAGRAHANIALRAIPADDLPAIREFVIALYRRSAFKRRQLPPSISLRGPEGFAEKPEKEL